MKDQYNTLKSISMKLTFTLFVIIFSVLQLQAQTELLLNPNFTSENYGWTVTQDFKYNTQYSNYNLDLGYAYMQQTDRASGVLSQTFSIPSNTTSCMLSFYHKITSDEVSTTIPYDICYVEIIDNSGNTYYFSTLSNVDESNSYLYKSFSIPNSFFGRQVTLRFVGFNDGAKPTIFRIDNCSVKATQTVVSKPDLSIAYPAINKTSVIAGDLVTLTADENNISNTAAGGHYVKYFLSKNTSLDGSDTYIDHQYISSVSPGFYGSCVKNYTIPTLNAGTYYILFQADAYNDIDESNENNNVNSIQFTVQPAPVNKPDLTVTSSFSTPGSITTDGSTILLNVNFKNQGTGSATFFAVKYFLSETSAYNAATAVLLATQSYNSLNTGNSSSASIYLTIPSGLSAGTKYILTYVDPSNAIDESNENNNIGAATLSVTSTPVNKPDLTVTSSFSTPGSITTDGSTILLNVNFKNQGTGNAIIFAVKYFLSETSAYNSATAVLLATQSYNSLNTGSSSAASIYLTIPSGLSAGTKYILSYIDPSNAIDESNENNNIGAATLSVTSTPVNKPDLTVTSATLSSSNLQSGDMVQVYTNVKNIGSGNCSVYSISYFYSPTQSYNSSTAVLLSKQNYSTLYAGSSASMSSYITLPASLSNGTKYILHFIDADNTVTESNEDNNIGVSPFIITPSTATNPELVITNFSAPSTGTISGSITVNCGIQNLGGTAANNFVVSFHLSDDAVVNNGDIYLGEYPVSVLSSNGSKSFSQQLVIPSNAIAGNKIIIASVDGSGVVQEQIENNNSSINYITISNAFIQALDFNATKSHLYWPFYSDADNSAINPISIWQGQSNGSAQPWHYSNNHDLDNNGEADHHTGESFYAQDWNYLSGNSDCGMSFYAPINGTIIRLSNEYTPSNNCVDDRSHSTAGNYFIILSNNNQYAFKACHFNELNSSLYVGKVIRSGDYLGRIGNTGSSDGTHAHCQLYKNLNSSLISTLRNNGKLGSVATDYTYACDFNFDAILDGTGGDDSTATALFTNKTGTLKLYPNPSDELVTLQLDKPINAAKITVFDLLGMVVYESTIVHVSQFIIPTATLENGSYFIHIASVDVEYTGRLLVQHGR